MTENIQQKEFSTDEFYEILNKLQMYHSVFYKLWLIGKPYFTESVSTAAVVFNRDGETIDFIVNEKFWSSLNEIQKCFIICHEMQHILLQHGKRITLKNNMIGNIAADIVVNHSLIKNFGFNRQEVDPKNVYCWIDTIFTAPKEIEENQSLEYYYNKLLNDPSSKNMELVDDHDVSDLSSIDGFLDEFKNNLSENELADYIGTNSGNNSFLVKKELIVKKKKWETIIKKWSLKYLTPDTENEQWARLNRRLAVLSDNLLLPSEMESTDPNMEKNKINVWFFQDTSGSCAHLATRFFKAAESLPDDRFDVKMHCFDTKVYETNLKSRKLYGFGGTTFTCIENYIQNYIKKNNLKYPEACFIITDGMGNKVQPEKPQNWHWFLSYKYLNCIPKESKIYNLKDFE